jgi:CubicO group peptidase (beta-lactamase class C family)
MWKPLYSASATGTTPADSESIGLSFFVVRQGRTGLIGHTGSQAGFLAFFYFNPENGKAVAAAFNTDTDPPARGPETAFQIIRKAALKLIE